MEVIISNKLDAASGSCDYFAVSTANDYAVLEWYGGYDPDEDDVLTGKFASYDMRTIFDQSADEEITVWIEDYNISKEEALEKLADKCESERNLSFRYSPIPPTNSASFTQCGGCGMCFPEIIILM